MGRGDLVVVGGGMAGLMAAALASQAGASVRVLEAGASLGGRARSRREHGFHLNQGAHAMFTGGPVERVLGRLGVKLRGGAVVPAHGRIVRGGRVVPFPAGPWSLLTSDLIDGRGKRELFAFLARPPKRGDVPEDATLRADFDARFTSPSARRFMELLVRLTSFTSDPAATGARDALAHLTLTLRGKTLYLHHGWRALVDDLHDAARAHGAATATIQRVASLRTSGGRLSGVELDGGETVDADAVILAVPPKVAAALAPDAPEVRAAADAAVPVRVACLDVGLARLPRPDLTYALALDEPLYYAVHSRYAELAPPGHALVQLMRYLRPGEAATGASREMERFLDLLQPGWQGHVRVRQDLPEMVASNWWPRAGAARPGPGVASVPGLFLAGDWVGDEGLLAQAAAASAEAASGLAVAHARAGRHGGGGPRALRA